MDEKRPFVTLAPESVARGIRFPTEEERASMLADVEAWARADALLEEAVATPFTAEERAAGVWRGSEVMRMVRKHQK